MAKSSFNSTLVAQRLNLAFKRQLVISSITNRNWEGELTKVGDTVTIVRPIGTTIRPYSNDTDITVDEVDGSPVSLVADQGDYFAFYMHDNENAAAYVNAFLNEDAYKLLNATDAYILGHYSDAAAANKVSVDVSAGDADAAKDMVAAIREARAKLSKQDVPEDGRYLVITPDDLNLIEEYLVTRQTGMGDDVVRRGFVGQLAGFNVFVSNNVTETGNGTSTDQYRHCLFGHVSGITYADAILDVERMRAQNRFADLVRGLHVYGSQVIDTTRIGELEVLVDEKD